MSSARIRAESSSAATPLGILAGGTGVPCEIAELAALRGRQVHIVALEGEAEPDIVRFPHTWVNWGGVGSMIRAFRRNGCEEIVLVGRVRRPNLMAIRPDLGFFQCLPVALRLLRGGDDAILRAVVRFFESHGLRVIGVHQAAPELIAPAGVIGRHQPSPAALQSVATCARALGALGPFDAAQAAVARGQTLRCVEGSDGTDAMLRRLSEPRPGAGRRPHSGNGHADSVLVKLPKSGQEMRIDLPAIGSQTVMRAAEAGLTGIAVLAGETLFAERAKAIELADAAGLFLLGIAPDDPLLAPGMTSARNVADAGGGLEGLTTIARKTPAARHLADAELGARLLGALEPFWPQASTIVSRGYVLATEGAGGAMAAAERAGRLKPWGARLLRRRTGVLVMSDIAGELGFDPAELVRRARASSLAGLVVLRSPLDETGLALLRVEADRAGLFLMTTGDML